LTAQSDVAARSLTTSDKSVRRQEVCPESAGINDFDSAVAHSVFISRALESVFGWHRWFLSDSVEGQPSEGLVLPWFMRHLSG
jgi:hypothetical protein